MIVRKVVTHEVDVPGLGAALKQAQLDSGKTVADVLREVEKIRGAKLSRTYWGQMVNEKTQVAYDLLKVLETVLNWDSGVTIDD